MPASVLPARIPKPVPRPDASHGYRLAGPYIAAILVVFAALGLRVWQLGNVPGVNGDEAWYGVLAEKIASGGATTWWTPTGNLVNPFYMGPLVLLHRWAEPSVVLLRSVAVASGILALAVNFFLCHRIYGRETATLSTLVLAVLPINIAYSRFGWDASQSLLATLPVVYLSLAAARRGRFPWSTLAAGGGALVLAALVHPTNVFLAPFVIAAGVRLSRGKGIWYRFNALPRSARIALAWILLVPTAVVGWLGRGWFLVAAERLLTPHEVFEFLNRFQRLFTGITVYQFIPGTFRGPGVSASGTVLAAYDVVGLATLGIALTFLIRRIRVGSYDLDRVLLWGWAASVTSFYLVAGPPALAPHWERYGICLVAPTAVVVARSGATWLREARSCERRMSICVAAALLLLGSFYWNYFRIFHLTGGNSHPTFRTGRTEPKAAAVQQILRESSGTGPRRILTSTWWTYWPLAYLTSHETNVEVLWASEASTDPGVMRERAAGGVWLVEFVDREELAAGPGASVPSRRAGSGIPRRRETFTFDYAGRAVLSIVRIDALPR